MPRVAQFFMKYSDELGRFSNFTDAFGKLIHNGVVKSFKPIAGLGLETERVADDFLGMPVEDDGEIHPAPVAKLDLGHVDAPVLVGAVSFDLALHGCATGTETHVFGNEKFLLFHDAVDALFVNGKPFAVFEISPDTAIAPEGVKSLEVDDTLKQGFVAMIDRHGMAPYS
jgi:hypothetical protein